MLLRKLIGWILLLVVVVFVNSKLLFFNDLKESVINHILLLLLAFPLIYSVAPFELITIVLRCVIIYEAITPDTDMQTPVVK